MKSQTKELLKKAAIGIANHLEKKAIPSERGISWKTKSMDSNGVIHWSTSASLYMGVAGIVLFFIELYRLTSNKRYLEFAKQGAIWIVDFFEQQKEFHLQSFFTGNLGAFYSLLIVSEVSGDRFFAKRAAELLHASKRYTGSDDDLLNGTAGVIIGLLHFDRIAKNDDYVLEEVDYYLDRILGSAYLTRQGVHWDRSKRVITGLCGYSHGAAGMGYTFLQIGKYFDNPAYYMLADEAFSYENAHYRKSINSWPDFRKMNFDDHAKKAFEENYKRKNYKFFETSADFTAWCHGATGIALSRIIAIECLKKKEYHLDIEKAVEKVFSNEYSSYTMCHGFAGDIILFNELYKFTNKKFFYEKAIQIMINGIDLEKKIHKYTDGFSAQGAEEDISLFNGIAGIGYCMLSLLNPLKVFNVLSPNVMGKIKKGRIIESQYQNICISSTSIKQKIISNYFPVTVKRAELNSQFYKKAQLSSAIVNDFKKLKLIGKQVSDIEIIKIKLESGLKSWALFGYEHTKQKEMTIKMLQNDGPSSHNALFRLSKYVKLFKAKDKSLRKTFHYIVYVNTSTLRSQHMEISEFEYDVLSCFRKQTSRDAVYEKIVKVYDSESIIPNYDLRQIFDNCINNSLSTLILFIHEE